MKKIALMILLGSALFTACNKNESVSPDDFEVSESVKSTLRIAFPQATNFTYTEVSPTDLEANFILKKEEMIAGITKSGNLKYQANVVDEATLPAISLDYLTINYTGYTLLRAGEKKDKTGATIGYMANIKHNNLFYHIHFDATGKFVSVVEKKGKHNGQGVKLAEADLPAAIKTYLDTNYPAYKFDDAISFSVDGTIKGYGVRITTADAKEIGLMFDGAGVFLRSREGDLGHHSGMGPGHGKGGGKGGPNGSGRGKDGVSIVKIEKTALPVAAITYLDTKYAGYTFERAGSITLNGVLSQYVVDFKLANKKYAVIFDLNGAFIKEITKK
jgi:hypothetical protein